MGRFLLIFLLCSSCWAQIVQVHSLEEIKEHYQTADSSTYGIFDIDMVLIQPDTPAFKMANIERFLPIAKRVIASVPPEKRDILYTLTSLHYETVLVDENTPRFFEELQRRGIPSFALTASMTGSLLHEPCLATWKCNHLRSQGIFFEKLTPFQSPITFKELPSYRDFYPQFLEGVLITNGGLCSKGKVLVSFLKKTGLSPSAVIFTDDKEGNLVSVEQALLEYDPSIEFLGLHYLGGLYSPTEPITAEEFTKCWEAVAAQAMLLE
jgi:Protein of unknown function (DUF2608)